MNDWFIFTCKTYIYILLLHVTGLDIQKKPTIRQLFAKKTITYLHIRDQSKNHPLYYLHLIMFFWGGNCLCVSRRLHIDLNKLFNVLFSANVSHRQLPAAKCVSVDLLKVLFFAAVLSSWGFSVQSLYIQSPSTWLLVSYGCHGFYFLFYSGITQVLIGH